MNRGEFDKYTRDAKKNALVLWKDSKDIIMESTNTGSEPIANVQHWHKKHWY